MFRENSSLLTENCEILFLQKCSCKTERHIDFREGKLLYNVHVQTTVNIFILAKIVTKIILIYLFMEKIDFRKIYVIFV
jgi:hypothetical protein